VTASEHHMPLAFHSGREADHSTPSSAEIKNAWSYTSTPKYTFIAWCSVKAQGQLYLLPSTFNIKTCRPANVI